MAPGSRLDDKGSVSTRQAMKRHRERHSERKWAAGVMEVLQEGFLEEVLCSLRPKDA